MGEAIPRLANQLAEMYKQTTPAEKFLEKKYNNFKERPLKSTVVIAVCMERQETEKIKEIEEIEAVACAIQNMHLTCTAYGLGAYWSTGGATYSDEMKLFLGLEPKDKCLGFFYVGYPNIEWPKSSRKPIEYVTEWITE
jgi:nitroreductase